MLEETGLDVEVGPVIEVFDRITHDEQQPRAVSLRARRLPVLAVGGELRRARTWTTAVLADPATLAEYHR